VKSKILLAAWSTFRKIFGPLGKSSLVLFAFSLSSFCSVTFFTDQASFDAAVQTANLSASTIEFDSTPQGDYSTAAGLTVNGANFVGPFAGGDNLQVYPANWDAPYIVGSGNVLVGVEEIDINLPQNIEAFGTYVNSSVMFYVNGGPWEEVLSVDGQSFLVTLTPADPFPFIGFLSTTPVATASLTGPSFVTVDHVEVGSVPQPPIATPEPMSASLALLGVELVLRSVIQKVRARRSQL
jgi:hypothetical protein